MFEVNQFDEIAWRYQILHNIRSAFDGPFIKVQIFEDLATLS